MTNYNQRSKFGGQKSMHKTMCADCKKQCEVPFRPNGMKPVYCMDCFPKNGGQVNTPTFSSKSSFTPSPRPYIDTKKMDEQIRLLEALNTKFDKLMVLAESLISQAPKLKKAAKKS